MEATRSPWKPRRPLASGLTSLAEAKRYSVLTVMIVAEEVS